MEEDDSDMQIELPDGKTGRILTAPFVFNFPFLEHITAEAIVQNSDGDIVVIKLKTPQEMDIEDIICPGHLRLSGEMLVEAITIEENIYNLHLAQPIEIITRALGNIPLNVLGIDTACNFVKFRFMEDWDEPIEIVTRFLGIFRVQTLGVDENCNLVTFVRADKWTIIVSIQPQKT